MKCIECAAELFPTTTSYTLKTIPPIEMHYLEAYKCKQCGEIYLTRSSLKKIEAVEKNLHNTTEIVWEEAIS